MGILRRNGWKLIIIVLISIIIRVSLLQLLPLRSSATFELPLSILSQAAGMMPVAAVMIVCCYTVIASVLIVIQDNIPGGKIKRMLACSLPFSLIWLMGVLESVPALGKPFLPELLIGLTDILPLLIMGMIISLWVSGDGKNIIPSAQVSASLSIPVIASAYFVGRYFLYSVVRVNSGFLAQGMETFYWTLAMGLAIGVGYSLLRSGGRGRTPLSKALWFGGIAFGLYWLLNNLFMPVVFDMSFIRFTPTIMNYIDRTVVDALFVGLGVYIFEKSNFSQGILPDGPITA